MWELKLYFYLSAGGFEKKTKEKKKKKKRVTYRYTCTCSYLRYRGAVLGLNI